MSFPQTDRFIRESLTGGFSRRQLLENGLRLGIATPMLTALLAAAPEVSAAPRPGLAPFRSGFQDADSGTFTAIIERGAADIDPHSSYETIGSAVCLGCYEMLLQYKGDSTSEFAPMLAESWEASADNASYTFH